MSSQSGCALCAIPKHTGSLPLNTTLEGRSELNGSKSFPQLALRTLLTEQGSSWKAAIDTLAENADMMQSVMITAFQIGHWPELPFGPSSK